MDGNIFTGRKSAKAIIMLVSFILAKVAAFLGPFWIANNSSIVFYGAVELYLSLGIWLAMLIGLGVPGAIPVQIIKNKNIRINDFSVWLLLFFAGAAALLILLINISGLNNFFILLPCIAFFSLAQQVLSPLVKSQKVSPLSPWLDNLAVHAVVVSCLAYYMLHGTDVDEAVFGVLAIVTLGALTFIAAWIPLKKVGGFFSLAGTYKECVAIGIPILLNGLVMMFIFNSGRLFIGFFYDETEVALYSYLFRIAGVGLICYQFFSIVFFKNIYASSSKETSGKVALLFGFIALESLACYVLLGWVAERFVPEKILEQGAISLFPLVVVQVNLWVLSAILEMRINSRGVTDQSARLCLFPSLMLVAAFWGVELLGLSSVFAACLCLCLVAFVTILIQVRVVNFQSDDPLNVVIPIVLACSPLAFLSGNF